MELNGTSYVILGMLNMEPKSGYEIKQLVDKSTRFFWSASYGQIYPELRRLKRAGLIKGKSSPRGGRKRTVYTLLPAGESALKEWLATPPKPPELRVEGLLKLFFADAMDEDRVIEHVHSMRHQQEATVYRLREIKPLAQSMPQRYPLFVLEYGLALTESAVELLERMERELAAGKEGESKKAVQKIRGG